MAIVGIVWRNILIKMKKNVFLDNNGSFYVCLNAMLNTLLVIYFIENFSKHWCTDLALTFNWSATKRTQTAQKVRWEKRKMWMKALLHKEDLSNLALPKMRKIWRSCWIGLSRIGSKREILNPSIASLNKTNRRSFLWREKKL